MTPIKHPTRRSKDQMAAASRDHQLARQAGADAFRSGMRCIAAHDGALKALVMGDATRWATYGEMIEAWQAGWNAARTSR